MIKSVLHYRKDDLYESITENGHKVMVDMRQPGEKINQSPVEMVLSALAGCAAIDTVLIMKKKRKNVFDLKVETSGERMTEHPKYLHKIHCHFVLFSDNATADELQKVVSITFDKYCSVATSLKANVTSTVEVVKPQA